MRTVEQTVSLRPDLAGFVHGIVSINPPTVQCDGCGALATGDTLNRLILTCGILFDGPQGDRRRLCRDCRSQKWGDK